MSQTQKHCEPLVAVWLRPSTTEPCICCKQVAEKPRGEHLKNDVCKVKKYHILTVNFQESKPPMICTKKFKISLFSSSIRST